jgi:hypothetical protein
VARYTAIFEKLLPWWITSAEGDGFGLYWVLSEWHDQRIERMRQTVTLRYPTHCVDDPKALAKHGETRGIPRGRTEPAEHYAARLKAWRYPRGHRTRGSAWALLDQVWHYFGGITALTVDRRGRTYQRDASGESGPTTYPAWDWDGRAIATHWGRFWLVLRPSAEQMQPLPEWGAEELWDWGSREGLGIRTGFGPADKAALRELVYPTKRGARPWRPAGVRAEWIILELVDGGGAYMVAPTSAWGAWGKLDGLDRYVPARDERARYVALREANQWAAGNASIWAAGGVAMVGGGFEAGDPVAASWGAVTLPGGGTSAGDPTSFAESVRLPDDGDPV